MEGIEKTQLIADFEFISVSEVIKQALNKELPNTDYTSQPESAPVNSGFRDLDRIIHSFNPKEVTTIAVRPGKGKTAFLLSLIHNLSINGNKKIAVFSPERSAVKLVQRLIESETGNSAERIYSGNYKETDKAKVEEVISKFIQSNILIDDSTSLSTKEIVSRCKYLSEENRVDLIIFDNFELYSKNILDTDVNFNEQEKIISAINSISKELDIPVVVLSHNTNMNILSENDKPTIENAAAFINKYSEVVIFIHRPNVIKPDLTDWKGFAELIIAKHPRVSIPECIKLKFIESSDRFTDI